ncbi:hypothetical protein G7054_g1790 [Neopestalotiopsis clavispora]|nr:hypothetical protein G7054_g1790 [Neopestalotiopsis clavispora]
MAPTHKAKCHKSVREQWHDSLTTHDQLKRSTILTNLLRKTETKHVTVSFDIPKEIWLEYVESRDADILIPSSASLSGNRRKHGSTRRSTESQSIEETDVDSIFAMYAAEKQARNTSNRAEPARTTTRHAATSTSIKQQPDVDSMYSQQPTGSSESPSKGSFQSNTSRCLKNLHTDAESDYTDQDLDSIYSTYSRDHATTQPSECSGDLVPAPLAMKKKAGFANLPLHIKKQIWKEAIPCKLLLAPKYWLRGFATRLRPPTVINFDEDAKATVEEMGGFYRLARPRQKASPGKPLFFSIHHPPLTWFSPEKDFLYFPCPAEKVVGVHTVAQHVVMESFEHLEPLQLHHRLQRLSDRDIFPALRTIRIASGVICADGDWTAEMVDGFFGPEHLVLVDLRDNGAIDRVAHKLLDLVHRNGGPAVKWYQKFLTLTRLFQYSEHWDDLRFIFGEAWLNATWKLPYTKIMWPKQGWREEVVPSASLENPCTKHHFRDAVIDDSEDFRSLDSQGQWDRTSPYAREILANMPTVSPVFVFVRPENLESLSRGTTSKRTSTDN